jgi:predicted nucleotidyltransferase
MMNRIQFQIPQEQIVAFCRRWKIRELALFGSALREDFTAKSDVDFLATFSKDAEWGLLDHVAMQHELQDMLHRQVDLVSRRALDRSQNWLRRREILSNSHTLFCEPEAVNETR